MSTFFRTRQFIPHPLYFILSLATKKGARSRMSGMIPNKAYYKKQAVSNSRKQPVFFA
jgi:hypothetical protein